MRLCTCGHRDARHDQLDGEIRAECLACSCPFFEDAKSLIEAEVYRPESVGPIVHIEAPEPYVAEAQALAEVDVAVFDLDEEERSAFAVAARARRAPLESFDAWRCAVCGSRSASNQRCNVRVSCRNRWREPVRVEIRSREAG